jgi:exosortase A-associated hydrolase 2
MSAGAESPLFFKSNGANLLGVLHEPDSESGKTPRNAIVMCSPFAEESQICRRVFVNFARSAAGLGIPVLRFDYFGSGDSDGEFSDASVEKWVGDIRVATTFVRSRLGTEKVWLVGLRFGGSLALLASENNPAVSSLILWDPVICMKSYMAELLRATLAAQLVRYGKVVRNRAALEKDLSLGVPVDVGGYQLSPSLYLGGKEIDILDRARHFQGDSLIATVRGAHGRANRGLLDLCSALRSTGGSSRLCFVEESPFWREQAAYVPRAEGLTNLTLNWILNR